MDILVCGAHGFIGKSLCAALSAQGHQLWYGVRHPNGPQDIYLDFTQSPSTWGTIPATIDVVINTIGIIQETQQQSFEAIHMVGLRALVDQCSALGIKHFIQFSALGVETQLTDYFKSKYAADQYLAQSGLKHTLIRPGLIYGDEGTSAGLFRRLALMPIIGLPTLKHQALQVTHIDDIVQLVINRIDDLTANNLILPSCTLDAVGDQTYSLKTVLLSYRQGLGIQHRPWIIPIPYFLMAWLSTLISFFRLPLALNKDTWLMLNTHYPARREELKRHLARAPRDIATFINPHTAELLRLQESAKLRNSLLRLSLSFIWLSTAIISAFIYPHQDSLGLLAALGFTGGLAWLMLISASALDALFAYLTWFKPHVRVWQAQIVLIVTYSLLIAWKLPEYIWHPFEPVLKNVLILAVLICLWMEDQS